MGDEGRLYVAPDIVPAYKNLLHSADLILPNAYEAELLSDIPIVDFASLTAAITKLHKTYQIPHIVVTSFRSANDKTDAASTSSPTLSVVGSSCRADFTPRIFSITSPALPIFFSGTGDMFAALMAVRLREAVLAASSSNGDLIATRAWLSSDDVSATELPLAKATEKVMASMYGVLTATAAIREKELEGVVEEEGMTDEEKKRVHLKRTRAGEIRVVAGVDMLRNPPSSDGEGAASFHAKAVDADV